MLPNSFPNYFGKLGCDNFEEEHDLITERLRKTLYYGKNPTTDRPSLPFTEIAVEFFNEAAPRELGKLDTYLASSSSRQTCMSPCSMMMGMLYVKRLRRHNLKYLHDVSSSDLFLISVMMASKFMYDEGVDDEVFNDEWAAAADMETEDVNELERQFLSAIDWKLFVSNQEFEQMLTTIEKRIALGQGLDRGWHSYTDLWILTQDLNFLKLCNDIGGEMTKAIMVSAVAYLAGILVMLGSTVLVTCMSVSLASVGPFISTSSQSSTITLSTASLPHVNNCTNNLCLKTGMDTTVVESADPRKEMEIPNGLQEHPSDSGNSEIEHLSTDSVLSQLWAVVTLQNSYVDFLRAVSDSYMFSSVSNFGRKHDQGQETLCADGPCLQNARKNCQNITKSFDGGLSLDFEPDICTNCQQKRQPSRNDFQASRCVRNGPVVDELSFGNNFVRKTFGVRCCCSSPSQITPDIFDPGSLLKTFSDISLGFMTGRHDTPWPTVLNI